MATIKDYVKYYKDLLFSETPFNDVDSLIFSQLVYADFDFIIPNNKGEYILFSDATRLLIKQLEKGKKKITKYFKEVYDLLQSLLESKRYANIKMYHYIKMVDKEKQFCAFTLRFSDMTYIAFEGTDTSIIGWKEDFLLSSTYPVLAQKFSAEYLNKTLGFFDNNVFIGGHSKGGNLAMSSYMLSNGRTQRKVKKIYNFDGPGFRKKEYDSKAYRQMVLKLKMFVPEDSTVGMILFHPDQYQVVKSKTSGIWQHDPFTWELFGGVFVLGHQTARSINLAKSNVDFISSLNDEERNKLIGVIFSIFDKLGITDTTQIKIPKLNQAISIVKEVTSIDSESRKRIVTLLKMMIKGI